MADAMLLAAAVAAMTFLVLRMLSPPEPLGLVVASGLWYLPWAWVLRLRYAPLTVFFGVFSLVHPCTNIYDDIPVYQFVKIKRHA